MTLSQPFSKAKFSSSDKWLRTGKLRRQPNKTSSKGSEAGMVSTHTIVFFFLGISKSTAHSTSLFSSQLLMVRRQYSGDPTGDGPRDNPGTGASVGMRSCRGSQLQAGSWISTYSTMKRKRKYAKE